jgi:hypothetical protein
MRDPSEAPTEYTRLRAQWVEDLGGGIVSTDWYEVAGQVSSSTAAGGKGTPPYKGKGKSAVGKETPAWP